MIDRSQYMNGQLAARQKKSFDDNPYYITDNRGIRKPTNDEFFLQWNLGFRDETDKIYRERGGFDGEALVASGAFRRKSNRFYKAR